jgi:bidirectional [NiFe] hydrogenase diaphorase subunit
LLGEDRRLQILERIMREHGYEKSALLEILHAAHELYGYFDKVLLEYISERLNLPPSHVYGVASFYNLFKFRRPGEHIISACMGTACYVKGAEEIISAIEKEFNLKRGGSTPDGKLSLFITRCIGACAMAPNVTIDNEVIGKATKEAVLERVRKVLGG